MGDHSKRRNKPTGSRRAGEKRTSQADDAQHPAGTYTQQPRYTCVLNPFTDYRASKCPACQRSTFERKFALFIHVDNAPPIILGKTCKYCARCEMIVVNQPEVAEQLCRIIDRRIEPSDWLVLGTIDKRYWEARLGEGPAVGDVPKILVRFKATRQVTYG